MFVHISSSGMVGRGVGFGVGLVVVMVEGVGRAIMDMIDLR